MSAVIPTASYIKTQFFRFSSPRNLTKWLGGLLSFFVAAAWPLVAHGQADRFDYDDDRREEVESILSGYASNLQALESYDVLIQMDSSWVSDKAPIVQTVTYVRMLFDHGSQRYLAVERSTTDSWVRPKKDVEARRTDQLIAGASFNGATSLRLRPDLRMASTSMEGGFSNLYNTPDIENIGLYRFPASFRLQSDEKRSAERRRLKVNIKKIQLDESRVFIEVKDTKLRDRRVTFDRQNMVPRSVVEFFTQQNGERVMTWKESYFFSLHHGIQLPDKIVRERVESKEVNSNKVLGTSTLIADFSWIKVNEPLDDELFVTKILDQDNRLLQLCSPIDGVPAKER
ncbi:hypothetical protein [Roseiconus lacunae]|uniref:hypothetical protein n=1 Tax=Roseiconus lacunae TaxID=2605694 RepID=UPI001E5FE00F|nr:hypothetical protein [Roseiconus lacunae]